MEQPRIEIVFDNTITHMQHNVIIAEYRMIFYNGQPHLYFFHHNNPYLIPLNQVAKITWLHDALVPPYVRTPIQTILDTKEGDCIIPSHTLN